MAIIRLIIMLLGGGLSNRIYGAGWFKGNKPAAAGGVALTVLIGLFLGGWPHDGIKLYTLPALALATGGLYWLGRCFPISYMFDCFNPTLVTTHAPIAWIEWITSKFYPNPPQVSATAGFTPPPAPPLSAEDKQAKDSLGMTLRGIYYYPIFILLGIAHIYYFGGFEWKALIIGLGVLVHGPIYAVQRYQPQSWWIKQYQVPAAESDFGAWLLFLIFLCT